LPARGSPKLLAMHPAKNLQDRKIHVVIDS
jgi:hypothetical protein